MGKQGFLKVTAADGREATIAVPEGDDWIKRVLKLGHFYEGWFLKRLAQLKMLDKDSVVVDVGASFGNHTVFFAQRCAKVFAFEPNTKSVNLLRKSISVNKLKNVAVFQAAAAAKEGSVDLRYEQLGNLGGSFFWYRDEELDWVAINESVFLSPKRKVSAPCVRLDDVINEKVDLIKIDAEGMELEVLAGAARLIKEHSPRIMVEVWEKQNAAAFDQWLKHSGYSPIGWGKTKLGLYLLGKK